jgi:DNA-binding MarR family transcriptional regulator
VTINYIAEAEMNSGEFKQKMWMLIHSTKKNFFKLIDPIIQKEGLTPLQAFILFSIKCSNITNVGSICRDLNINQGNVSTMCKKLEKAGFVRRSRTSDDERIVSVTLTEQGLGVLAKLDKEFNLHSEKMSVIPDEKFDIIINGFEELDALIKAL